MAISGVAQIIQIADLHIKIRMTYARLHHGKFELIDTTPLITHRYNLADIAEAYHLFENKLDGVIKVAVEP